jgi:hypothetical protein
MIISPKKEFTITIPISFLYSILTLYSFGIIPSGKVVSMAKWISIGVGLIFSVLIVLNKLPAPKTQIKPNYGKFIAGIFIQGLMLSVILTKSYEEFKVLTFLIIGYIIITIITKCAIQKKFS